MSSSEPSHAQLSHPDIFKRPGSTHSSPFTLHYKKTGSPMNPLHFPSKIKLCPSCVSSGQAGRAILVLESEPYVSPGWSSNHYLCDGTPVNNYYPRQSRTIPWLTTAPHLTLLLLLLEEVTRTGPYSLTLSVGRLNPLTTTPLPLEYEDNPLSTTT